MRSRERSLKERGAAAVEFALVFPMVIMLLLTVVEFSRLWNIQATLTDAAGIAARYAGIHHEEPSVIADAIEKAKIPGLVDWSTATIDVAADCAGGGEATAFISVSPGSITTWFTTAIGSPVELNATGRMPCR
ncbi:TadE/TadG family type IV pilus assembly protein [Agromyces albus]|uniref:Pilus assembly protein n=1 Tax=Agromyces albus TaxID=205332 RepID=A0A4Q2L8I4_9MICO|nr:TadE/TadG family type IV pilus assembly protein [Agromyces albus]RXZ72681.1 pilus assembly protein [Agromyces albus]